jgi:hypothetical protein
LEQQNQNTQVADSTSRVGSASTVRDDNRNPSTTKRGPGRRHKQGATKDTPIKSKGAPRGFVLHTNAAKRQRRDDIKARGGIRAYKRMLYTERDMLAKDGEAA